MPVDLTCAKCGLPFRVIPCRAGTAQFCSRACRDTRGASNIAPRFWAKVSVRKRDECWPWAGARRPRGYGNVNHGGSTKLAHRLAWELTHGPIPDGMVVCHRCDNPPCCNPAHLFLGTTQDNVDDARVKGRLPRGERVWAAKLTVDAVREIRRLATAGVTRKALAVRFGVTRNHIDRLVTRKQWRHVA